MPAKSSLFILVTCLFMHACDSRFLNALTKLDVQNKFHQDKIEEKLDMSFSPIDNSMLRRTTLSSKPEEEEVLCKKNKGNKGANSGNEDCKSSLHKVLLNEKKPQDSRWPQHNEEDFMETDYQLPRRKSPIHN